MVSQVATSLQTCANCGKPLDKFQAPCVWREQVVCPACHSKLRAQEPAAALCPSAGPLLRHGRGRRKRSRKKWVRLVCRVGQALGIVMILMAILEGASAMLQIDADPRAARIVLFTLGIPGLVCWLISFALEKLYG